jgi:hypothetical protein
LGSHIQLKITERFLVVDVDAVELRRIVMSVVDDRSYERLFTLHQSGSYDDVYAEESYPSWGKPPTGQRDGSRWPCRRRGAGSSGPGAVVCDHEGQLALREVTVQRLGWSETNLGDQLLDHRVALDLDPIDTAVVALAIAKSGLADRAGGRHGEILIQL